MARKPNNLLLIAVVVLAIGGMIGLNIMGQKNDPVIQEKIAKDAQAEAQKKQMEASKNASPQPAEAPQTPGAEEVAAWGAEKQLGKAGGKPSVVVGWTWTPQIQGNPSSLYTAVNAVKTAMPNASIRVVNLDAKPGGAQPGISVDGALRVKPTDDGTFPPTEAFVPSLMQPAAPSAAPK